MIAYQTYREAVKPFEGTLVGGSESPQMYRVYSEEDWESFTDEERYNVLVEIGHSQTSTTGNRLLADEDGVNAFNEKFGADRLQNNVEINNTQLTNDLVYGYGKPKLYGKDIEEWAVDPSRIVYLPDGRWVMEANNIRGDKLAGFQQEDDDSGLGDGTSWAWTAVALLGTAALAGYSGALGPATAADPLAAAAGQGFGTAQGAGIGSYGATGAVPDFSNVQGGSSTTAGPTGAPTGAPTGSPTGSPTGAPTGAPTGSPSGVPTVDVPGPITPSTPGPGSPALVDTPGIVQAGNPNILQQGLNWYNGLSPGSRYILGSAVNQGANALLSARAQREAQEQQDERDERTREDRVRRGSIPAFGHAFTPRTGGIINSRRGG